MSGIRHRPASSYEDTLTLGAEDARTAALWKAHRQRLAALLAKLRVGRPTPRTDAYDPFAFRALLLLAVFVLVIVVGDSAADRLWSAFRLSPIAKGAEARLDAWITPPPYTSKPPIMLADGGITGPKAQEKRPLGTMEVPDKSLLVVRAGGAGMRGLVIDVPGENGASQRLEAPTPANSGDVLELKHEMRRSGTITVSSSGTQLASWTFTVTPDHAPKIVLTKEPERSLRGSLKIFFKAEDDYGVVSAEARVRRLTPKADTSSTAWARKINKGARPPYERPPALALRLPRSYAKTVEGNSLHEIGDHPWAGMRVELTLIAKDLAGQTGRSDTIEITLPERRFTKALARAVVEQRRRLVEDPRDRAMVAKAIDALTLEPEDFIEDLQVFLGLRSAYWRLQREDTRANRNSVVAQLWNVALRIEDGNLSDAERALARRAGKAAAGAARRRVGRRDPAPDAGAAAGTGAVPGAAQSAGRRPAADAGQQSQSADDVAAGPGAHAAQPGGYGALGRPRDGAADAEPVARPARSIAVGPHGRSGPEPALRPDDGRVRRYHRPAAEAARRHLRPAAQAGRPARPEG